MRDFPITANERGWVIGRNAAVGLPSDPRDIQRILAANPKPVAIVATSDRFQVGGQPAEIGSNYTVDATTAASLVAIGKAKLA